MFSIFYEQFQVHFLLAFLPPTLSTWARVEVKGCRLKARPNTKRSSSSTKHSSGWHLLSFSGCSLPSNPPQSSFAILRLIRQRGSKDCSLLKLEDNDINVIKLQCFARHRRHTPIKTDSWLLWGVPSSTKDATRKNLKIMSRYPYIVFFNKCT